MDAASLILWGARTGNCLRATIGLCEADIPFTTRRISFSEGEHKSEAFLQLNPDAKVPVLNGTGQDGDQGVTLTQSNAILFYADQRNPGRLLPTDGVARIRALERFFYFVTDVIGPNGAAFAVKRRRHLDAAQALAEISIEAIVRSERFLKNAPFMGGDSFSIADIAAFTIIKASEEDLPWSDLPLLNSWIKAVGERPALQRGWMMFDKPR